MNIKMVKRMVIGAFLIGGVVLANGRFQTQAQQPEQPPQPATVVTDCFESREGYTQVTRVENAVPEYGYPNVKCSEATGGVLWWGAPFDGTTSMGEMPKLEDGTKGSYQTEEAVVKPREPKLTYYNMDPEKGCVMCHDGKQVPFPEDKNPRAIAMHLEILGVDDSTKLMHGRAALWCLDCHSTTNRNRLIDHMGGEISFNQPQRLCGKCHGEVYIDWRLGIHGKRIGEWTKGGKKRWWVCTECHNPHTVQVARFQPFKPEPAPHLPKGMKGAEHERSHHGGHAAVEHGESAPAGH